MRQPLTARLLDGRGWLFLAVLAIVALAVSAANLLLPPSSPFYIPNYWMPLLGKYLCYALLAVAVDLIWGYAGILSLGHGAFFALGGYAMGMYLMRQMVRLCRADGVSGSRRAGVRVRLVCLPLACHRRLSVDHHPGADLRADARILSQQFRLRRQ
jgi:ABC-type branched-subunit amino acid transport system permease subunit